MELSDKVKPESTLTWLQRLYLKEDIGVVVSKEPVTLLTPNSPVILYTCTEYGIKSDGEHYKMTLESSSLSVGDRVAVTERKWELLPFPFPYLHVMTQTKEGTLVREKGVKRVEGYKVLK